MRKIESIPAVFRLLALFLSMTGALVFAGCTLTPSEGANAFDRQMNVALEAFRKGDTAAADRALKDAVRMGGGESGIYVEIGQRLEDRGRPAEAARFLETALKRKELSWDPMLWAALARASGKSGNTDRSGQARSLAREHANEIMERIESDPTKQKKGKDPWSRPSEPFLRAGFYFLSEEIRDSAQAIDALREAVRLEPDSAEALNALGYTLADVGQEPEQFAEALELTRKAADLSPGNPMILDSLGWAQFKNNDLKGARRALREAVDAAPDQAELRYHLGVVYAQLGQIHEAETELARALKLRPNYPEAKDAQKRLRVKPGEGILQGA